MNTRRPDKILDAVRRGRAFFLSEVGADPLDSLGFIETLSCKLAGLAQSPSHAPFDGIHRATGALFEIGSSHGLTDHHEYWAHCFGGLDRPVSGCILVAIDPDEEADSPLRFFVVPSEVLPSSGHLKMNVLKGNRPYESVDSKWLQYEVAPGDLATEVTRIADEASSEWL
jgi:hypothetical protein